MKRIIFLLILSFFTICLISCRSKPIEISDVNEFEELFNGAIKYDIRSEKECEDGHIPGFMCMGENDLDTIIKNIDLVSFNNEQKIILIGNEEDVLYVFNGLSKLKHKNMYYFKGGYLEYTSKKGDDYKAETGCGC